jgi:hypothetical protein
MEAKNKVIAVCSKRLAAVLDSETSAMGAGWIITLCRCMYLNLVWLDAEFRHFGVEMYISIGVSGTLNSLRLKEPCAFTGERVFIGGSCARRSLIAWFSARLGSVLSHKAYVQDAAYARGCQGVVELELTK